MSVRESYAPPPAMPEGTVPYPDELVQRYIGATISFAQMQTGGNVVVGDYVIGKTVDGDYSWEQYERGAPNDTHHYLLGAAMMGAHRANGIRFWLGHSRKGREVTLERLGGLLQGPLVSVSNATAYFANQISVDRFYEVEDAGRHVLSATNTRTAGNFIADQMADGTPGPELRALRILYAAANNALAPSNPEARELRQHIRNDLRTAALPQWRHLLRPQRILNAIRRMQRTPNVIEDMLWGTIKAAQPTIQAECGLHVADPVVAGFIYRLFISK